MWCQCFYFLASACFPQFPYSRSILSFSAILFYNVASSFVLVRNGEFEICTLSLKYLVATEPTTIVFNSLSKLLSIT